MAPVATETDNRKIGKICSCVQSPGFNPGHKWKFENGGFTLKTHQIFSSWICD